MLHRLSQLRTVHPKPIERQERTGSILPLSFAQQRLWFLNQLQPGNTAYIVPTVVRLRGKLRAPALWASLDEIVRRHESLRTSFPETGGEARQEIAASMPLVTREADLRGLDAFELEREWRTIKSIEEQQPFDLATGPLFRATLLRLADGQDVLIMVMHHIISDGWSMGVLFNELNELYRAYSTGEASALKELPIQYADYAIWQRDWLSDGALDEHLSYWRKQLAGAPALLELPTDRPRPATPSFRAGHVESRLPDILTQKLNTLSRHEGVTPFMTILAAFEILLHRYSGQDDIVVGTPIAGRGRAELEGLIGFFVNTLALRIDLRADPTLRQVLKRAREACLEAYAHQELPFEKLVEELQPERSTSHAPLFQVILTLQNNPKQHLQLGDLRATTIGTIGGAAKFDLSLGVNELDGAMFCLFEYSTDIFDRETIQSLSSHFVTLLGALTSDLDQPIGRVPLLSEAERNQILLGWNDTHRPYPREATLDELFQAQARRSPDSVALLSGAGSLTCQELNRRANQLARYLNQLRAGPESLVGIMMERRAEMVVAMIAVLKAGAAYLPLDPSYPEQRLATMLEDAHPPVIITQSRFAGALPASDANIVDLDDSWNAISQKEDTNPESNASASNLAYLIYTSGSTGRPKGTAITHLSATVFLHWAANVFPPEVRSGVLASTSICFDLSIFELFVPLCWGGTAVLAGNALELPDLEERHRVTLINTVPSAMAELVTMGAIPASAKVVNLAGEPLPRPTVDRLYAHGEVEQVYNLYGPSEDTTYSTYSLMSPTESRTPVIGKPVANTSVFMLDWLLEPVPVGVPGELYLSGDGLARGYLNRPDLTADRFVPCPFPAVPGARAYRTGDLGRYLRDGNIEYLGRVDRQVKVRGYRIELGEIEAVLRQYWEVREAVVVAPEDKPGDKRLIAYAVGHEGIEPNLADVHVYLKDKLPAYMLPSGYVVLDELPLTPNGKIDRGALSSPQVVRTENEGSYAPPRTPVEEVICNVWGDVLRLELVGVHDNFFNIGGHSLLATQALSRIRHAFKVDVAVRELFELPTPAELAVTVERRLHESRSSAAPSITPEPRGQWLPLSFAQQGLWLIEQLRPDTPAYNMGHTVRLLGPLDVSQLKKTFTEILRRHESLRTRFSFYDGKPMQFVDHPRPFTLREMNLEGMPSDSLEAAVTAAASREVQRPCNLARDPLFRATLIRLAEQEHVLVMVMHHIISDGWSMGVFFGELKEIYEAYLRGEESPLPELPIQYGDYAIWQRRWLTDEALEDQLSYWRNHLAGSAPVLQMPTDRPRPAAPTFQAAYREFRLTADLADQLKALSRREGVTLFMTLLAAFELLLSQHSGQQDVTVGTPIAGRPRPELEGLIGLFVNTLPLRVDLSDEPSFQELLKQTREVCLGAYAHQDAPFELIVEDIAPERSTGHTPLFQVLFALQNATWETMQLSGIRLENLNVGNGSSSYDLSLFLSADQSIGGWIEYQTELFDDQTVERMTSRYVNLLEAAVADAQRSLSPATLLRDSERSQIISRINETPRPQRVSADRASVRSPNTARYIPPRDDLEGAIAVIWQELLKVDRVGVLDNFFHIGGHSLLAVGMIARIGNRFGKKLSLASIVEGPTIEQLARRLRADADSTTNGPIVPIQPRGSLTPFFCVHPAGGHVLCYTDLALCLGADQPFYGLEAMGDAVEPESDAIEAMAARYIEAMLQVQREGPYCLGGWSFGGLVAFEMAQQLMAIGSQVSLLALFDPPIPQGGKSPAADETGVFLAFALDLGVPRERLLGSLEEIRKPEPEVRLQFLLDQLKQCNGLAQDIELSQIRRYFQIFKANVSAAGQYVPMPYPGRLNLFRPVERQDEDPSDSTNGWRRLAAQGLDLHIVSGSHFTMVREPHVSVLGAQLSVCIRKSNSADKGRRPK
ncbi:MAG TPA: amino acid adenylation domain-containing protein [Blastocatellia bacterium]|nr:amino acid adenylation domain-containing protein [Blastocatellia bacterium]